MQNKFLLSVFILLYLLIVGDCVSTYFCLTASTSAYRVWEGNPVTNWLFQWVGLVPGLVLLAVAKAVGLFYLFAVAKTGRVYYLLILIGMLGATLIAGYVNYNNWSVYYHILHR